MFCVLYFDLFQLLIVSMSDTQAGIRAVLIPIYPVGTNEIFESVFLVQLKTIFINV